MAQVGRNGVFFGKTVEKDMKKKMWDALTYIRMLTDLRPRRHRKWRHNDVKMAKIGGNGIFEKNPFKKTWKRKTEADAGLLSLLDSLLISANYQT